MSAVLVESEALTMTYGQGDLAQTVLRQVSLAVRGGEACLIMGPSGSGKTTLLSILGCLLSPSGGQLRIGGEAIDFSSRRDLILTRRRSIGFVFQHAQLLPFLSVYDNLLTVGINARMAVDELGSRIVALLSALSIEALRDRKPGQLSGGQRQRVAICRALLARPQLILADEPTAALDWQQGKRVTEMLIEQAREDGAALIMVSHDDRLIPAFDRLLHLNEGVLQEEAPDGGLE